MKKKFLSHEQETQIDALFKEWDTDHTPGAAVGIIKDGEFVYKKCFGMANLEYGIPITPDSKFNLASVSKQFTAACIALLILDGKLSIDDDVRKYIPELPQYEKTITIKHLLHHTSGLMTYDCLLDIKFGDYNQFFNNNHALNVVFTQKNLNFLPGEQCVYSNTGYLLLAEIVKRISGKTIREYAHEHIFQPLGMKNTFYKNKSDEVIVHRVESYENTNNFYSKYLETNEIDGAGGLISTLDDLCKWINNFRNKTIGGEKFTEVMFQKSDIEFSKDAYYSFGLVHAELNNITQISHGGSYMGFRTIVSMLPTKNTSMIILCNTNTANPAGKCSGIADIIFGKPNSNKNEKHDYFQNNEPINVSKNDLLKFCGHYWFETLKNVRMIYIKKGKLYYWRNEKSEDELCPISENTFVFVPPRGSFITFDCEAGIKKMTFTGIANDVYVSYEFKPERKTEKYLKQFEGGYFCDDLNAYYMISIQSKTLSIWVNGRKISDLNHEKKDYFSIKEGGYCIIFDRDGHNMITGFTIYTDRARQIQFKKVKRGILK